MTFMVSCVQLWTKWPKKSGGHFKNSTRGKMNPRRPVRHHRYITHPTTGSCRMPSWNSLRIVENKDANREIFPWELMDEYRRDGINGIGKVKTKMTRKFVKEKLTDHNEKKCLGKIARQSAISAQRKCLASGVSVVTMEGDRILEKSADGTVTVIKTLQNKSPRAGFTKRKYGNIIVVKSSTKQKKRFARKKT